MIDKFDMYKDYSNSILDYYNLITFKNKGRDYLELNNRCLEQNYGAPFNFSFTICEDASVDFVSQKYWDINTFSNSYRLTFYNFRFELVIDYDLVSNGSELVLTISQEDAVKYFPKGLYYIQLTSLNESGEVIDISNQVKLLHVK